MGNLISDREALKANSVLFLLPTIWWLDALKKDRKLSRKNAFEQTEKKPGLKFNPGLALLAFEQVGPHQDLHRHELRNVMRNTHLL